MFSLLFYELYFFWQQQSWRFKFQVFERPNVFIWSELQKIMKFNKKKPLLSSQNYRIAIPSLIFTVSSKYRKSKLTKIRIKSTYAFDTNSGLK